jgi:hypothetical protein
MLAGLGAGGGGALRALCVAVVRAEPRQHRALWGWLVVCASGQPPMRAAGGGLPQTHRPARPPARPPTCLQAARASELPAAVKALYAQTLPAGGSATGPAAFCAQERGSNWRPLGWQAVSGPGPGVTTAWGAQQLQASSYQQNWLVSCRPAS